MLKLPWIFGNVIRRPSFNFPRLKVRWPTEVPTGLIYALILASVYYVFIGGVYDLVQHPESIGGYQLPEIFYKSVDQQYMLEGIIAGTTMFLGALGLYLVHYATNFNTDLRKSTTLLGLGWIIAFIALIMIVSFYKTKLTRT